MIEAYVGLIGGGKSFNAVAKMAEYIASGGMVATNIELMYHPWFNRRYPKMKRFKVLRPSLLSPDAFKHLYFDGFYYWANARGLLHYLKTKFSWTLQKGQILDLNNEQIEGALHEHLPSGTADKPVLVVVDEAVDFFDMDDRKTANKSFLTFLRYSRKLNIDIIMIAQEFTELNKRIRNQVQWVWTFKDLGTERVPVLRMKFPPPYCFNIAGAQWSGRTFGGQGGEPVKVHMRWKDQAIFACYRTEELFREVKVLRGVKTKFSANGLPDNEEDQMNKIQQVALYACLAMSILSAISVRKVSKQVPVSPVASVDGSGAPQVVIKEPPRVSVLYGQFRYGRSTSRGLFDLRIDGIEYSVGDYTPSGVVVAVNEDQVHMIDDDGNTTFIYPSYTTTAIPDGYVHMDTLGVEDLGEG